MASTDQLPLSPEVADFLEGVPPPNWRALLYRALVVGLISSVHLISGALLACVIVVFSPARAERFLAQRLVSLLQRLGPTFIKAGQILSTRRDVLPPVLCDELAVLQDSITPISAAQARTVLADIYGERLDEIFEQIDYSAVASGSIACIYRARLRTGGDAVIKLQRPGIREIMAADLTLILRIGALVAKLPLLHDIPVRGVLDHLSRAVYAQLDFARESENLQRLREHLSRVPRIWIPGLNAALCRDRAVVMEFVPGLNCRSAQQCSVAVCKGLAGSLLAAVFTMLFVDGFVHCDLHPGNLYFKKSGHVVILDAGFTMQMSERIRRLFAEFFLNMALGDGRRCAEIVIESAGGKSPNADEAGFTAHFAQVVKRNSRLPAKDFSLIEFAGELFDLQRRFGLRAASELVFPLLSLLVIEGTVRFLDPDADFQKAAEPVLTQGVFGVRSTGNY